MRHLDPPSQDASRRDAVRALAHDVGFDLVGVVHPDPSDHVEFYERWLGRGLHGEMGYLERPDAVARRGDLTRTMEDVRSVVVVGQAYFQEDAPGVPDDPAVGVVARYARGRDYHKVVKKGLLRLLERIREEVEPGARGRAYVDTGPILERELARRAGLGWFGRNTMLIDPRRGSYFFLGCLLLDLELEPDEPFEADHCGTCRSCLDACPTGALLGRDENGAPVMDARRCISYLTIEHRGPIPEELRPLMANRVYGCDICQEVCPFNTRFAEASDEPGYAARGPGELPVGVQPVPGVDALSGERALPGERAVEAGRRHAHPGTEAPSLVELMRMTGEDWEGYSRGSAIRRAGYAGFKRNVAVAMGNWLAAVDDPPGEAVAVLRDALEGEDPLVQEHAAWALGRLFRS